MQVTQLVFTRNFLSFVIASTLLLSTPAPARVALIIGNSNYAQGSLENPINDANAVAKALREMGFEVELLVDQKRDSMRASIQNFGAKLAAKKQPSVFYFAGHALQLEWRNYLLPTDIAIRKPEDVATQAVDLNDLLQQLSKAAVANGGSSNIVILDACRDNPFGKNANAGKGLTQIDAPAGTLLAYATAPGNVAQDAGTGANGLYTENLLKEMRSEGAKIEDVLKRVRLSVRLQSKGQQVPWESTSLEEDFYFKPPRSTVKLSRADAEKAFEEEFAAWDIVRGTTNLLAMENFMRRYPSGKFSELAQYRLENLLSAASAGSPAATLTPPATNYEPGSIQAIIAAAVVVAQQNSKSDNYPPAKPGEIRQGWQNGDLMVYRETPLAGIFKISTTVRQRVFRAFSTQVELRSRQVIDHYGYPKGQFGGTLASSDMQMLIRDYQVGKKWSTRFVSGGPGGNYWTEGEGKVLARETLDTPAGKFETFKVSLKAEELSGPQRKYDQTWWIDVVSRKPIAYEKFETEADGFVRDHRKGVLVQFENDGPIDRD